MAQGSGEQAPTSRALPERNQKSSKTRELADGSVTRVGSILKSELMQDGSVDRVGTRGKKELPTGRLSRPHQEVVQIQTLTSNHSDF